MNRIPKKIKNAAPFVLMLIGGSIGLREFTSIRFEFPRTKFLTTAEVEESSVKKKDPKEATFDAIFEEHEKKVDTENWSNKRGPREYEEGNELFQEAIERTEKLEKEGKLVNR